MSLLLNIFLGVILGYILLVFILRYLNFIFDTSIYILGFGLWLVVCVILLVTSSSLFSLSLEDEVKDILGGSICSIFVILMFWNRFYNQHSFLTLEFNKSEKSYFLKLIESSVILLIGGSLTVLILGI
ncbi:hypothetical protein OAS37_07450 [Alphaproteobacteria bacterium]|nr:hypothetical protein [Alphaproteobacteria bacterium]